MRTQNGSASPEAIHAIQGHFGDRLLTLPTHRAEYGKSECHFEPVLPDAVLRAQSVDDVVQLVKFANEYRFSLIPYGAGTSVEGNTIPIHGGVTIDLSGLDRIIAVNSSDLDCVVEPGVRREDLNLHLRDQGLFFPIDPGANATIGGMASTRASGTNAVRYGTMRDCVLGLKVVTADGKIVRTSRRAKKSAAGYDLTGLFVGSEGTLGIVVEVNLKLFGIPETISSAVCAFETTRGAVQSVVELIQLGVPVARAEILDDLQIQAVNKWSKLEFAEKPTLFFEFHGSPASVAEQIEIVSGISKANGGTEFRWAERLEDRNVLWKARHDAYYATVNLRPGAVGWATDVCVPIGSLAQCIDETQADLRTCPVPATILGHVGDGNFHVVFSIDPRSDSEMNIVEAVNKRLIARAIALDGTCTGEHGIGIGKKKALEDELGCAVDIMRRIKSAIDPLGIFNTGKIFS
ncbi:FAD-binding oxidoreductase [Novosphingobium taihuense]|uniref:D-lactate dehydrogenase (cytochrome) n=2 Tax=Novosphingobium taihuense TaxID=260085 RepID=A0A7W7AFA6_9SPHN|nr:FAD-linked oxidase C-terminal domain-containing protein [Novosphingobium taihuense]MBB4615791.1 D-lactate dehydrogenase (cytochrome) [Novosphingobium taihuense]